MRSLRQKTAAFSLLVAASGAVVFSAERLFGGPSDDAKAAEATLPAFSMRELAREIEERRSRVVEFQFIAEEAKKLGVRAWLFGGTAAAYGHYVRWDLQRERGDSRFRKDRFDYDYTNIFRSTQDLDIVIDGDPEQAEALRKALVEKYPGFQGGKDANWEVRLLDKGMGDKEALLNNADFMNQHTDSNSTGLVELTRPSAQESVIRDLRDWRSTQPNFLKDVHEGTLHYYFSPGHDATSRALKGLNPPIVSVIRYLTKAFQYDLKIRPEDLQRIREMIEQFDPKGAQMKNEYVRRWIEKNGKKLVQNAVNIESAVDTLDRLGLRSKLIAIKNDFDTADSLAWWLNKKPLTTRPLGEGAGKTATEIFGERGIGRPGEPLILGHVTRDFAAFESIVRAPSGEANVFVSRVNGASEAAALGEGFYTLTGRYGLGKEGYTIRFVLDPAAREGTDFEISKSKGETASIVLVKNRAAIRVLPESLSLSAADYLERLAHGNGFEDSEKGILDKLKRSHAIKVPTETEKARILAVVRSVVNGEVEPESGAQIMREWVKLPYSSENPESVRLLERWLSTHPNDFPLGIEMFSSHAWRRHAEILNAVIDRQAADFDLVDQVFSRQPAWAKSPAYLERLLAKGEVTEPIVNRVLSLPEWRERFDLVEKIAEGGKADRALVRLIGSTSGWSEDSRRIELLKKLSTREEAGVQIALALLTQPESASHPELLKSLLSAGTADRYLVRYVLTKAHWKDSPEAFETLMELIRRGNLDEQIGRFTLTSEAWKNHPRLEELEKALLSNGDIPKYRIDAWLRPDPQSNDSKEIDRLLEIMRADGSHRSFVSTHMASELSRAAIFEHPRARELILELGRLPRTYGRQPWEFGLHPKWSEIPEWSEELRSGKWNASERYQDFDWLKPAHWTDNPEAVETFRAIMDSGNYDAYRLSSVLLSWMDNERRQPVVEAWARLPGMTSAIEELMRNREIMFRVHEVFSSEEIRKRIDPVNTLTRMYWSGYDHRGFAAVLNNRNIPWAGRPEGYEILADLTAHSQSQVSDLGEILERRGWASHPDGHSTILNLVERIRKDKNSPSEGRRKFSEEGPAEVERLLGLRHWTFHPGLRSICGGRNPTYACLNEAVARRGHFWKAPVFPSNCLKEVRKSIEALAP